MSSPFVSEEILELADQVHRAIVQTAELNPPLGDEHRWLAAYLLAKTVTSFHAVRLLCVHGYGEDALVLARTMIENAINLAYINKDPTGRVGLFLDYHYIEANHQLTELKKVLGQEPLFPPETEREIMNGYERVRTKYPKKDRWSGKPLSAMATECGLEVQYALVYRFGSEIAHGAISSLHRYVSEEENQVQVRLGTPARDLTDEALLSGSISVLMALAEVYHLYGFEPPSAFEEANRLIKNMVGANQQQQGKR